MTTTTDEAIAEMAHEVQEVAVRDAWTLVRHVTDREHERALTDRLLAAKVRIPDVARVSAAQLALCAAAARTVWLEGPTFPLGSQSILLAWIVPDQDPFALTNTGLAALGTTYEPTLWAPQDDDRPGLEDLRAAVRERQLVDDLAPWLTGAQLDAIRDHELVVTQRLEDGAVLAMEAKRGPVVVDDGGIVSQPTHVRPFGCDVEIPFLMRRR